jgi:manganese transport protein
LKDSTTNGQAGLPRSLEEVHESVQIPATPSLWRRFIAFSGPAYLVSVGYMDPGNWATDLEGGARFGYRLIWVLLMSNAMAVLLQTLSARLGLVTRRDLAQACRENYPRSVSYTLWILCEIAIAATDLAEVLGSAVALNLLFHIPLVWGVIITALDVVILLTLQRAGIRRLEAFILSLVSIIGISFFVQIVLVKPDWRGVAGGFVPHLGGNEALYVALGMLGATVMPHNLYLHSALVQTRAVAASHRAKESAGRFNLLDSVLALNGAFFVNAAILVMAAALFWRRGIVVTEIQQAHELLKPLLGTVLAPIAFAVALLASGQSSTVTGTLSGQIVMEGFARLRLPPWIRRLATRLLAVIPAVIVIGIMGSHGTYLLLIFSQVVLSLQLPFAIVPLVHFTSDRRLMHEFANKLWVKILAWLVAATIIILNGKLVVDALTGWMTATKGDKVMIYIVILVALVLGILLAWMIFTPTLRKIRRAGAPAHIPEELPKLTHYKLIGLALERSNADEAVLRHAMSVAKPFNAELVLLHVVDSAAGRWHGAEAHDLETDVDAKYLEGLAAQLEAAGFITRTELRFGEAITELIAAVNEHHLDLLVVGAHGHGPVGDVVYGETVDKVRHGVTIPVLVAR